MWDGVRTQCTVESPTETSELVRRAMGYGGHGTHLKTRPRNVFERPKQYMERDRPSSPMRMTGLRPTRSEVRLQCSTVMACVRKKRDCCPRASFNEAERSRDKLRTKSPT